MKQRTEANGSKKDDWATPDWLLDKIREEFGDFFDPCPLHADFDGLSMTEWGDVNYINPPYSAPLKELFIEKAYAQFLKGKKCILLLPAATETRIFHNIIAPNAEVRLLFRRVKFKGYNSKGEYTESGTGQSGSMLCIFGNKPKIIVCDMHKRCK